MDDVDPVSDAAGRLNHVAAMLGRLQRRVGAMTGALMVLMLIHLILVGIEASKVCGR